MGSDLSAGRQAGIQEFYTHPLLIITPLINFVNVETPPVSGLQ